MLGYSWRAGRGRLSLATGLLWAATRLQATMDILIEGKVFAFELQEDLCEHACSVGAAVLRLWAGRATGTEILRGVLRGCRRSLMELCRHVAQLRCPR